LNSTDTIRVICVDDHEFLLEGLKSRLDAEHDIEIIATLPSADDLVSTAERLSPAVILLDIEMPGRDTFETIQELAERIPGSRVVLLSAFVRQSYLDLAVSSGAWGYVSKRESPAEIALAVRKVAGGGFAFSPQVRDACGLDDTDSAPAAGADRPQSRLNRLTNRELQILRMIGRGMPRSEIAAAIHRSPKTVDAHRSSIMDKLDLHDRVELARFAIREGLVEL
jgi:DNA-binding NarL/FixJ family response regulator